MSLYGALFSGVSGLQAQSSAMGAIADNVTNVNTVGYKNTEVNFRTLVTKQASLTQYSAGGVQSKPRAAIDVQGLLQASTSSTDIGISGGGFFIVNEASEPAQGDLYAYTRAGSFKVDKEGYLQNVAGYYLQGWPMENWDGTVSAAQVTVGTDVYMKSYTNDAGDTVYINDNAIDGTNLRPLNLSTIGGTAISTSSMSFGANLPAGANVGNTEQGNVLIYDSLGNPHNLLYNYTKAGQNQWNVELSPPAGSEYVTIDDQFQEAYFSAGRTDFTAIPQDGESMTVTVDGVAITLNFVNGAGADAHPAYDIEVGGGVSLSTVMDEVAANLETAFQTVYAANISGGNPLGITPPGTFVDRVAGESAITFRQFSKTSAITVDATGLTDGLNNPAVVQSNLYAVPALTGTNYAWIDLDPNHPDYDPTHVAVEFNGDGTIDTLFGWDETSAPDPRIQTTIGWGNGAADMDGSSPDNAALSFFVGNYNTADGLTQFAGNYQINYISQNGAQFGNFAGVSIGEDGIVTALFDNGVTRPIFMIPLATFVNPNGMEALSGNVWIETDNSGQPTVREAGDAGAGSTEAAALEASTVDLGEEFTTMITTQRAYSAATKIITTADEMLDELIRIKR